MAGYGWVLVGAAIYGVVAGIVEIVKDEKSKKDK